MQIKEKIGVGLSILSLAGIMVSSYNFITGIKESQERITNYFKEDVSREKIVGSKLMLEKIMSEFRTQAEKQYRIEDANILNSAEAALKSAENYYQTARQYHSQLANPHFRKTLREYKEMTETNEIGKTFGLMFLYCILLTVGVAMYTNARSRREIK